MNYPVWELYYTGGGFLIALIAVVHVYVAHFAVGGGLFLVLTEMKGLRENSAKILEYTQKHSKFFLLLTMVFSSVTGVGIWFTISLLSPGATSVLIHTFVFGFAMEWVCFTIEIVAIFLYFYTFNKIENRAHLILGWIYAIAAMISLVLINGIIAFMLTPGDWLETKNFWDGFFNPSFLSSMFFRITIALTLAGIFGFVTAVFIKDKDFREQMIRYCAKWLLFPFFFMVVFAFWYLSALPDSIQAMILGRSPEIIPFTKIFAIILPVLFISGLLMAIKLPWKIKKPMAFIILLIGLVYMGSFEWIREAGRRPFLINDYMYSTSVKLTDEALINQKGLLNTAKWVKQKEIKDDNVIDAGKEIFKLQCICCHSVRGHMNDILPLTEKFSVFSMDSQLNGQGKINDYMPKFLGTREERLALSKYIVTILNGKKETSPEKSTVLSQQDQPLKIPAFDEEKNEYILLAWNNFGMHFSAGNLKNWIIPEKTDLTAQLIKRGETPEIITQEVEMIYKFDSGPESSSENIQFDIDEENQAFIAKDIPVTPYSKKKSNYSYPLLIVEAREKDSGKIFASTKVAAPVSEEMGCNKCHGSKGSSDEVLLDILTIHDRISKTQLTKEVKEGRSVICQSCHSDDLLNISAAVHGFHANYLTDREAESCNTCHTSSADNNQCLKGIHYEIGLECTNCHGNLEDHALSLLKAEKTAGKAGAEKLMKYLVPTRVDFVSGVKPRTPWINEPDCLNCHIDFNEPETDETFNVWTESVDELYRSSMDDAGVMCQACHGSTHALYPAVNVDGKERYNIQPMQYQGTPYPIGSNKNCKVCHIIDMDEEIHHPNTLTMFRNIR